MTDHSDIDALLRELVDDVLANGLLDDPSWSSYGLAAGVHDDQSTVQAAYTYAPDGTATPAAGAQRSFTLVELREATRDEEGRAWDVMVLQLDRVRGEATLRFVAGAETAEWPLAPTDDATLIELLRLPPVDADPA
jgi:hypothetical protein